MKRAFITGITGQDGSYLAELLLDKGYEVGGIVRRCSVANYSRIEHLMSRMDTCFGDMIDPNSLYKAIFNFKPTEIYNLAAQSHVAVSFKNPAYTFEATAMGAMNLLNAFKSYVDAGNACKFYQASSSEMFGNATTRVQNEKTPLVPVSPYGIAKVAAHYYATNMRDQGYWVCQGILHNHESPRRGLHFVTRKITSELAKATIYPVLKRETKKLRLGNISAKRDWGHAKEFVLAMWMMMQQEKPDTFVIATGNSYSVSDFLNRVLTMLNLDYEKNVIVEDPRYIRPVELSSLRGDSAKARRLLGWKPEITFDQLVKEMVESDLNLASKGKL